MHTTDTGRGALRRAGALLLGGMLVLSAVTQGIHPHGDENDHAVIFTKYAESDAWIAVHFAQFAGVLIVLAGFVALFQHLRDRGQDGLLARIALGTTIGAAATFGVLQAVDGVALKHAVDAWAGASGPEKATRFADAETIRWTEWGLQAYFRLFLGLTFALFGAALARSRSIAPAFGGLAILGGGLYAAIGIAVGHSGLDKPGGLAIQLMFLAFIGAVLAAGRRERATERAAAPRPLSA